MLRSWRTEVKIMRQQICRKTREGSKSTGNKRADETFQKKKERNENIGTAPDSGTISGVSLGK